MRKSVFVLPMLFTIMAGILCSCKNAESDYSQNSMEDDGSVQSVISDSQEGESIIASNIHALHKAGEFEFVNAGEGAYVIEQIYPNSSTISYIDYVSGVKTPLCSTPGCTHQSDACTSYIAQKGYFPPRILWAGDYLLIAYEASSENGPCKVERRNPDGTNPVELCRFGEGGYITGQYLYDDTAFYYTHVEFTSEGTENKTLEAIDLETGSRTSVYRLGESYVAGGFGNKILLQENVYDTATQKYSLLNIETLEKEECLSVNLENEYARVVDDGIAVVNQTEHNLRWQPITKDGEVKDEKIISLNLPDTMIAATPYHLFSGFIELDVSYRSNGQDNMINYIIDLNEGTQKESEMVLGEQGILYPVVGEYGNKVCVVYNIEIHSFDFFAEDGTPQTVDYVCNLYGMMEKDDFLNSIPAVQEVA